MQRSSGGIQKRYDAASMGEDHDVTVSGALQQLEPLTLRSLFNRHIDAGASHEIEDRYEVEKSYCINNFALTQDKTRYLGLTTLRRISRIH